MTQNCKCGTATCYLSNPDYCCASKNSCNSVKSACQTTCGITTTTTTTLPTCASRGGHCTSSPDSYCGGVGYTSYTSSDCASYCVKCNCAATENCNNGGIDDDCNGLADCQDPACAQTDFCLGQNPCDTGYQDGNWMSGAVPPAADTCTQSPVPCGPGAAYCCYGAEHDSKPTGSVYTYCCYASMDTTQVVASDCPTTCSNLQLKTYLGETCMSAGWACTYNTLVVQCCNDLDCQNAGIYCSQYGNRYAKCNTNLHTCTICGACDITWKTTAQCASNTCCDIDVGGSGNCVGPTAYQYSSKWLCA